MRADDTHWTLSPTTLISDNGPQFTSHEFKDKMKLWNIKHIFSPPYHPSSNGQAERSVQIYKDRLKKMNVSNKPLDMILALAYIGKVYGLTPHASTDRCPYELVKQGSLPSLFPGLTSNVNQKAELTVTKHCSGNLRKRKIFDEGDRVVVYDNHTKLSYPAVVSEILGTNNYLVYSDNGSKHVSGDVMSHAAAAPAAAIPAPGTVARAPDADRYQDDTSTVADDVQSVLSDGSDDLDIAIAPNAHNNNNFRNNDNVAINNNPYRPGRRELRQLDAAHMLPERLRSGRV